ncbi:MAG: lamin tail domain-containing protein, partial [Lysobacter sp.]
MNKVLSRLAVLAFSFAVTAPVHAQVVISQVYGGGGNSGAPLRSDFIELHNNGATSVDLAGWSVQYGSSGGTSWQRTNLSGSIAPGGYYLIKQADGGNIAAPALPTPDAIGTIAMSGTAGKVALV